MVPVGRLLVLRYTPPSQRMVAMFNLVWPSLTGTLDITGPVFPIGPPS